MVPGAYLIRADQEKQDPDFWYLTGVESPYAVLVIVRLGKLAGGSPVPSPTSTNSPEPSTRWRTNGSVSRSGTGPDAMTLFTLRAESYNAVDRIMEPGDLLFVDYGAAEHEMYSSDLCRTWPVSGRFTPDQRKYYEIVLEAQEASIRNVRPGVMMPGVAPLASRWWKLPRPAGRHGCFARGRGSSQGGRCRDETRSGGPRERESPRPLEGGALREASIRNRSLLRRPLRRESVLRGRGAGDSAPDFRAASDRSRARRRRR